MIFDIGLLVLILLIFIFQEYRLKKLSKAPVFKFVDNEIPRDEENHLKTGVYHMTDKHDCDVARKSDDFEQEGY